MHRSNRGTEVTPDLRYVFFMAFAHAIQVADRIDAEIGIPKVELRRMLDEGLVEFERGEGIVMDDAALDWLRHEPCRRRQPRP